MGGKYLVSYPDPNIIAVAHRHALFIAILVTQPHVITHTNSNTAVRQATEERGEYVHEVLRENVRYGDVIVEGILLGTVGPINQIRNHEVRCCCQQHQVGYHTQYHKHFNGTDEHLGVLIGPRGVLLASPVPAASKDGGTGPEAHEEGQKAAAHKEV